MKRQKRDKITKEIEDVMFSMWVNGLTHKEIADIFIAKGLNIATFSVHNISKKHNWKKRKNEIIEASEEVIRHRKIISKVKKASALSTAVEVLADTIRQDYLDYKTDPIKFKADVADGRRPRPLWQVKDVYEAAALLEAEKKIYEPDKEPSVVINNNTTNNEATALVLGSAELVELMGLMAQAKLKTWEKSVEETKLIEGEVVKTEDEQPE